MKLHKGLSVYLSVYEIFMKWQMGLPFTVNYSITWQWCRMQKGLCVCVCVCVCVGGGNCLFLGGASRSSRFYHSSQMYLILCTLYYVIYIYICVYVCVGGGGQTTLYPPLSKLGVWPSCTPRSHISVWIVDPYHQPPWAMFSTNWPRGGAVVDPLPVERKTIIMGRNLCILYRRI